MKSPILPVCMAIFVIAGCSHTIPETATKPQAPPQLRKDASGHPAAQRRSKTGASP